MNNLKAERTLTAEELQAIIDGCEGLPEGPYSAHDHEADLLDGKGRWMALWHGDPIWHHFARMDPATVKAMAYLALQSLSIQQPMGEVRTPQVWHMSLADHEERLAAECFKSGFAIEAEEHGLKARFHRNSAAFFAALHPNQESGE